MLLSIKILFVFIISGSYLQAKDTLFIEDAVKQLLENNFAVRISQMNSEIAENNVTMGNAGMLPSVDANASFTHNVQDIQTQVRIGEQGGPVPTNTTNASISKNTVAGAQLSWTLFDGMNMFLSYDRLKILEEKSQIELQIAMQNMIRQFYAVYYQAVTLKKNLIAARQTVEISKERLDKLREKENFGAALKLEVLRAKVDLNADSTDLLQLQLNYDNAKRDIYYLLGNTIYEDFEINPEIELDEIPDERTLRQSTLKSNTSINQALANKEVSVYDKRRIQSTMFPRINFNMGYNFSRQQSDGGFLLLNQTDGLSVGVNAQVNLFNGFQTRTQVQNAEIIKMMNDVTIEQIRAQIAMEFDKTIQNYNQSLQILNKEIENRETASLSFQRSQELYELGQITSLELREAQRNLLLSEFRLNSAQFQVKIAETELLLLSSKLID